MSVTEGCKTVTFTTVEMEVIRTALRARYYDILRAIASCPTSLAGLDMPEVLHRHLLSEQAKLEELLARLEAM